MRVAVYALACKSAAVLTLPRRYRLARRIGFSRILNQRAQTNSWFAVHSSLNLSGHARLGMSVSKRLIPSSTRRNTVKRLIRECFRHLARNGTACDLVIRLRKPLEIKDIPKARAVLDKMLESALAVK